MCGKYFFPPQNDGFRARAVRQWRRIQRRATDEITLDPNAVTSAPAVRRPARAAGALHTAYLAGYPDGTIRPEAPVTRAQLAVILFRLAEHVPEQTDAEMPDVPPEHWAHGAAALACRTEVMNLQPDGLFHPEQTVTGPELACALNRLTTHEAAAAVWPSLKAGWETAEISFAAGNGWVMGFDGETFDADAPLSPRAACADPQRAAGPDARLARRSPARDADF